MSSRRRVGVFWDVENCQAPSGASGYSLVTNVRGAIQDEIGPISSFKAYLDIEQQSRPQLRSELQLSAVTLVDTPHNGHKNVADQMMLVDIMAYALDGAPDSTSLVLITGDQDFAYAVAFLRMRGYPVTVIGPVKRSASLFAHASTKIDWNTICQGVVPPLESSSAAPKTQLDWRAETPSPRPQLLPSGPFVPFEKTSTLGTIKKPAVASGSAVPRINPYLLTMLGRPTPTSPPVKSAETNNPPLPTGWSEAGASEPSTSESENETPDPEDSDSNASSTSQASSSRGSSPSDWELPAHYRPLIKALNNCRAHGNAKPLRSAIGIELGPQVYKAAGVDRFKTYIELAVSDNIVQIGGSDGFAWIALNKKYWSGVDWSKIYC